MNEITFPQSDTFEHKKLGPLGVNEHFFVELSGFFQTYKKVEICFNIYSDDGFKLEIDNAAVAEHLSDRPFQLSSGTVELFPGIHKYKLEYFQGFGPMGLLASYSIDQNSHFFPVGHSIEVLRFLKYEHISKYDPP